MANLFTALYRGFRSQFYGYGTELNSMLNPVLPYQRHAKQGGRYDDVGDEYQPMQTSGQSFGQSLLHLPLGILNVLR